MSVNGVVGLMRCTSLSTSTCVPNIRLGDRPGGIIILDEDAQIKHVSRRPRPAPQYIRKPYRPDAFVPPPEKFWMPSLSLVTGLVGVIGIVVTLWRMVSK